MQLSTFSTFQEKRSEFIKSGLACNPKSKQEVEKYRTLPAINRPGVLTTDCKLNYQGNSTSISYTPSYYNIIHVNAL